MTTVQTTEKVLTSLEVAEMVGREHSKVIRDIRKTMEHLGEAKIGYTPYFLETTYENEQNGQYYPMFLLTKKGCELYSTRMTGAKGTAFAVQYIERFNAMEETLQQPKLPTNYKEALIALVEAEEVKEQLQLEVKEKEELLIEQAPKVEALDVLTGNTDKLHTTMHIATNYGMSAKGLNALLHELGVQYKKSGVWKLYAKYEGNGYTATPTGESEQGYIYKNMKWTNKGEYFLYNFLKERGYTSTVYEEMFESNLPTEL